MHGTVDEIGRVAEAENISCGYAKGGWIRVARNGAQTSRMQAEVAEPGAHGELLTAEEARSHLNATDVRCGIYSPDCAAIDPARLVRGLAEVVSAAGVGIVEGTAVTSIGEGALATTHGTIRAEVVVRATEAYTRDLKGERRTLLPVYSLMVATEPLPESMFDEIGLTGRPTFSDDRFMVIYGQRTEDNRLAFGGRRVPYLFGSKISSHAETHEASHALIRKTLIELLPVLKDAQFTHRWGGVLGIPRDWVPGLRFDKTTGVGILGGYVGEGVAAANLAGRTMAELIVGENTERTNLPWVGHTTRRWEPEPLRWLGVRSSRRILLTADDREFANESESKIAYKISKFLKGA
jgi:glycine/D-amino acid oxidase-like deaminating enzyme